MSYPDQLESLLKTLSFDDIVPWTKALPRGEAKEVKVRIRKLAKANHENFSILHHQKVLRGEFLLLTALSVFSNQERIHLPLYLTSYIREIPTFRLIAVFKAFDSLTWANDWIRQTKQKNRWIGFTYNELRMLIEHQVITHDPKLFAEELCFNYFHERTYKASREDILYTISKDRFLIDHDLESVFFYETNIHDPYAGVRFDNRETPPLLWLEIYQFLIAEKKLDRGRILQLCLEGLVRDDFSNNLRKWFKDLFVGLEPTSEELFKLQALLLALLTTEASIPVSMAVDFLKKMVFQKGFAWEEFLQRSESVLSRADIKSTRKTLLDVLLKFPKSYSETQTRVTELAVASLLSTDAVIQQKATKIITQWGNTQDETLREQIDLYSANLSAKSIASLADYEPAVQINTQQVRYTYNPKISVQLLTEANQINPIQDWPELLYELTTALQSDDPLKIERIMDGIVRLPHLPSDAAEQLNPLLGEHYFYFGESIPQLLTWLLKDWVSGFRSQKLGNYKDSRQHDPFLRIWHLRFKQIKIAQAAGLPFLSTPTHAPSWISPSVLIKRLAWYQQAKKAYEPFDFLIAIARTRLEDTQKALSSLNQLEESTEKSIMKFLLDPEQDLILPDEKKTFRQKIFQRLLLSNETDESTIELSYYAVAARTKSPRRNWIAFESTEIGNYPNVSSLYPFEWKNEFEQQTLRWHQEPISLQKMQFTYQMHKHFLPTLLYSLHYPLNGSSHESQDFNFITLFNYSACLIPNYRESIYYRSLQVRALRYKTNQTDNQLLQKILQTFLPEEVILYECGLMLLARGFLSAKAPERAMAQEIFIQKVDRQSLNVKELGQCIGKLLKEDFAPLQRLIESLEAMRRLSALHEDALIQFIENILISQSHTQPPKNTVKLLLIYQDLLALHQRKVPEFLAKHFTHWQQYGSLKKIILEITRLS